MNNLSTAIYQNRINDKNRVEIDLNLNEFGNSTTIFMLKNNIKFAIGYNRIVYGDHGPYIEFEKNHICCKLFSKFNNVIDFENIPQNPKFYYYWLYPESNSDVKVYFQLKTVFDLKNAPKRSDNRKSDYNREEGYADYKIGKFYVDPYQFEKIKV